MKQRPRTATQHAPRSLTERELHQIGGGSIVILMPPPPMPEVNRNLK